MFYPSLRDSSGLLDKKMLQLSSMLHGAWRRQFVSSWMFYLHAGLSTNENMISYEISILSFQIWLV